MAAVHRPLVSVAVALAVLAAGCSAGDDGAPGAAAGEPTGTTVAGAARGGGECTDEVADGPDAAAIEQVVTAVAEEEDLRTVLWAVSRDGELIGAGALGESLPGEAATTAMHVRVGNVAYAYLGTLLLLMAEAGEVQLDTTVAELLPDVDLPDADEVTLEMLVRNTSGWPDHVRTDAFVEGFEADPFRTSTVDELLDHSRAVPPWFAPGTGWTYSHTGHVVLGEALAAAADQPLEDLLTERVIEPLGLTDTAPALGVAVPEPVLHTFTDERGVWEESTSFNPSWQTAPGSVVTSTVCDLVVSAAGIGSGRLLTDGSYATFVEPTAAALAPQPEGCPPEVCRQQTEDAYYALGVRVADGWVLQAPLFGGTGGVHAYLPDEDLAIAVVAVLGPDTPDIGNPADVVWSALADELVPATDGDGDLDGPTG